MAPNTWRQAAGELKAAAQALIGKRRRAELVFGFLIFRGVAWLRSFLRIGGLLVLLRLAAVAACLQSRAENVAERRTRICRSILRDRLFLFGNFERFDRDGDLARATIELRDPRVHLLADGKALGALIAAVA